MKYYRRQSLSAWSMILYRKHFIHADVQLRFTGYKSSETLHSSTVPFVEPYIYSAYYITIALKQYIYLYAININTCTHFYICLINITSNNKNILQNCRLKFTLLYLNFEIYFPYRIIIFYSSKFLLQ